MASSTFAHEPDPVSGRRLWLGVLLAPAAWLIAGAVGRYLASRSCAPHVGGVPLDRTEHPAMAPVLVALAMAAVAFAGLVVALSNWHALRRAAGHFRPGVSGRAPVMAVGGIVISALFLIGIAVFVLRPLFGSACRA